MGKDCDILVPEDFMCSVLSKPELRDRYSQLSFYDYVKVGSPSCQFMVMLRYVLPNYILCLP